MVHALNLPSQSLKNHLTEDQPINTENIYTLKLSLTTKKTTTKPTKPFQSKSKPKLNFDLKNITCYKCGQKGHTFRFCRINTKLHEL